METGQPNSPQGLTPVIDRLRRVQKYLSRAILAESTLTAYAYDWAMFQDWCKEVGRQSLPATTETVELYLAALIDEGKRVTTARRRTCAIAHYHRAANVPNPVTPAVKTLLTGARRAKKEKPEQKTPITVEQLRAIGERLRNKGNPIAMRNLAILVVGFASALRRSNLVQLLLSDVEITEEGVILTIQKEKQDQEGVGRVVALPRGKTPTTCPRACLEAWLKLRGDEPGPLFIRLDRAAVHSKQMDAEAVCKIVKHEMAALGADPSQYGGHSMRAGFITEAAEAGVSDLVIASHTGHRSVHTLKRYFRRTKLWQSNPAGMVGL